MLGSCKMSDRQTYHNRCSNVMYVNVRVLQDMDPRLISWKGGAVLACLDTTQEMWIHQREWQRFGVRMLRERAAFVW